MTAIRRWPSSASRAVRGLGYTGTSGLLTARDVDTWTPGQSHYPRKTLAAAKGRISALNFFLRRPSSVRDQLSPATAALTTSVRHAVLRVLDRVQVALARFHQRARVGAKFSDLSTPTRCLSESLTSAVQKPSRPLITALSRCLTRDSRNSPLWRIRSLARSLTEGFSRAVPNSHASSV